MKDRKVLKSLALISQFGINMLVPIVLCSLAGMGLDRLFDTKFIVVILFFLGALAGFRNIYMMSKEIFTDGADEPRKH